MAPHVFSQEQSFILLRELKGTLHPSMSGPGNASAAPHLFHGMILEFLPHELFEKG